MRRRGEERRVELAPRHVPRGRERAQGAAVVRLPAGDDLRLPGMTGLDVILPRQLDRRLDRLAAAGDEVDAPGGPQVARAERGDALRQPERLARDELRGVGEGEPPGLRRHHGGDLLHPVADGADDRPAGAVEVGPPGAVPDPDPLGAHRDRVIGPEVPGEEVRGRDAARPRAGARRAAREAARPGRGAGAGGPRRRGAGRGGARSPPPRRSIGGSPPRRRSPAPP